MIQNIAACVILYYPDKNITDRIQTFLPHVNKIYLLDNTPGGTSMVSDLIRIPNAEYIDNKKNIGVATALNTALHKASQEGFKWLLTMDQDSSFANERFFIAAENILNTADVIIISPNHDQKITETEDLKSHSTDMIMTSGNLVNIRLAESIGGFNEDFFIDEVDHDFCLKARLRNYKILFFPYIILKHTIGDTHEVKWFGKKKRIAVHSPVRYYYMTRNNFYMFGKYGKSFPKIIRKRKLYLYKEIISIIKYQDHKLQKLSHVFRGFIDFLKGRTGEFK